MVIDSMEPEVDEKDVTIINPPQSLDADQVEEVEEPPKADDCMYFSKLISET